MPSFSVVTGSTSGASTAVGSSACTSMRSWVSRSLTACQTANMTGNGITSTLGR